MSDRNKPGEGKKYDAGKTRHELLSDLAIEELAKVLTFGAKKYAADNWRSGMEWRRLIGAARRHIAEFSMGNDIDPDSGLSHLAHAMCCLMFLEEYSQTDKGTDDRFALDTFEPASERASPPPPTDGRTRTERIPSSSPFASSCRECGRDTPCQVHACSRLFCCCAPDESGFKSV